MENLTLSQIINKHHNIRKAFQQGALSDASGLARELWEEIQQCSDADETHHAVIRYNLALIYEKKGDFPEALNQYHETLQLIEPCQGVLVMALQARLYFRMAYIYFQQAEYSRAQVFAEKAQTFFHQAGGEVSRTELEQNQLLLALTQSALGDHEPALACCREILDRYSQRDPQGLMPYAHLLINYSTLLIRAGRQDEALTWLEKAVEPIEQAPDPDRASLMAWLMTVGNAYLNSDNLEEALVYFRRAAELRDDYHGRLTLSTISARLSQAFASQLAGQPQAASELYADQLKLLRKLDVHTPDMLRARMLQVLNDLSTDDSVTGLRTLREKLNHWADEFSYRRVELRTWSYYLAEWMAAVGLDQEALDVLAPCQQFVENQLGRDHPEMAHLEQCYAHLALERFCWVEADVSGQEVENVRQDSLRLASEALQRALAIREKTIGRLHPETIACSLEACSLQVQLGDADAARARLTELLNLHREEQILTSTDLAWLYAQLGYLAAFDHVSDKEPEYYFDQVQTLSQTQKSSTDPRVAHTYSLAAAYYVHTQQLNKGLAALTQVRTHRESCYGPDHPCTADIVFQIAELQQQLENFDEALDHFEQAAYAWAASSGRQAPSILACYAHMADILTAKHRYLEALRLFDAMLEQKAELNRAEPEWLIDTYQKMASLCTSVQQHQTALHYLRNATSVSEAHFGIEHPVTTQLYLETSEFEQRLKIESGIT